ncbi:MAG: FAD-binding protein [Raoultibacter sp.]
MKEQISRRSFLAAAGAGALGLGLAGCAGSQNNKEAGASSGAVSWDKETDILVVGSGTAAFAALAAKKYGAESVLLIEKESTWGGTSATSGGGVGIPLTTAAKNEGVQDSLEKVLTYYKQASQGRADEAVVESYVSNGDAFLKWTGEALGFEWGLSPQKLFQDYYEPLDGFLPFGRGCISVVSINGEKKSQTGPAVWAVLQKAVEEAGVEVLMETAADDLIVEGNVVVGVRASTKKGKLNIRAKTAVILGTGGFEHNDDMRSRYLPSPLLATNSCVGNTGDAQRMGMKIGANLSHMDRSWGVPFFLPAGKDPAVMILNNEIVFDMKGTDWAMYRPRPGAIVVNRRGERIGDESAAYDTYNRVFSDFDTRTMTFFNIPAFFICDSGCASAYPFPGTKAPGDPMPDFFVKADTLEELADKLGIDKAGLAAEVASFNEGASNGKDPKYHRGESNFSILTCGTIMGSRTDIPNQVLAPLLTPPFYGAMYVPGTCGTNGGLTINGNAQVVNLQGEAIPQLYAVGNCSSGVSGGAYCHGGMTLGSGSVMGWVAVRHALGVS